MRSYYQHWQMAWLPYQNNCKSWWTTLSKLTSKFVRDLIHAYFLGSIWWGKIITLMVTHHWQSYSNNTLRYRIWTDTLLVGLTRYIKYLSNQLVRTRSIVIWRNWRYSLEILISYWIVRINWRTFCPIISIWVRIRMR